MTPLAWLLIIVLLVLAIGGAPRWGYHQLGWGPSGLGLLLLILLIIVVWRGGL